MILEGSSVQRHESNAENTVSNMKDMVRTIRSGLKGRCVLDFNGIHVVYGWMVEHTTEMINRYRRGTDGKTANQRWKGRKAKENVVEFGECVWYHKVMKEQGGEVTEEQTRKGGTKEFG